MAFLSPSVRTFPLTANPLAAALLGGASTGNDAGYIYGANAPGGVNTIPFSAPSSQPLAPMAAPPPTSTASGDPNLMPQSRINTLAYLLKNQTPVDYSTVRSPMEGLAKALTSGVQGWEASQLYQGEQGRKVAQAQTMADLLAGPATSADGTPNQKNQVLKSLLVSGAVDPTALATPMAMALGMPRPLQFGQIGTNITGQNTYGFIDPVNRQVTPVNPDTGSVDLTGGTTENSTGQGVAGGSEAKPGAVYNKLPAAWQDMAKAIYEGRSPPLTGYILRTPQGIAISSGIYDYAAMQGKPYDATKWTQRNSFTTTMNGARQMRLSQSLDTLGQSIPLTKQLIDQWDANSALGPLNAARLKLAEQGALGQQAQSIATQLDHQIAQINADQAVVFMGGNSPTDSAFQLAEKSLNPEGWSSQTLRDNLALVESNIAYRKYAQQNVAPAGFNEATGQPPPPEAYVPAAGRGGAAVPPPNGQSFQEGQTATGPNGARIIFQGGQWVPMK